MADSLNSVLAEFTAKRMELDQLHEEHAEIFGQEEAIKTELIDIEGILKETARAEGRGAENDRFNVRVVTKTKKFYNPLLIWRNVQDDEVQETLMSKGAFEVNRNKLDNLIEDKLVPSNVTAGALEEEPMTPAIYIDDKTGGKHE